MKALLLAALLCTLVVGSAQAKPRPGAAGIGDPYFPKDGNGGYDVAHYGLNIAYTPKTRVLKGVATITATATQDLSRFNLDFRTPHGALGDDRRPHGDVAPPRQRADDHPAGPPSRDGARGS